MNNGKEVRGSNDREKREKMIRYRTNNIKEVSQGLDKKAEDPIVFVQKLTEGWWCSHCPGLL